VAPDEAEALDHPAAQHAPHHLETHLFFREGAIDSPVSNEG